MFIFKNVIKNKLSSIIIILIMIISMVGCNVVFNLFFNSAIESYESSIVSKDNSVLSVVFQNKQNLNDVTSFMKNIDESGIKATFSKTITFKGEFFDKDINIMCTTNPSMYKYNLISGRNISVDDIKNRKKIAVISKIYESICRKEGDKLFIDIDDNSYEVIGMVGNKYSSSFYKFDIFIPYTAIPDKWIATDKIASFQLLINAKDFDISKYKGNLPIKESYTSEPSTQKVLGFLFGTSEYVKYFVILAITSIVNMVIFSMYWINKKQKQIGILKALGYSNIETNSLIMKELLFLALVASIISSILYYPFAIFFNSNFFVLGLQGSPIILLVDILFSFICCFIVIIFNSRRIRKLSINSNINTYNNLSKKLWVKIIIIIEIFLLFSYSLKAFYTMDFVFGTINKANSIVDISNVSIIDPFSVSFDNDILQKYSSGKFLSNLKKEKDVTLINYLYDCDSSKAVSAMNNKSKKDYYDINYIHKCNYLIKNNNLIPLIYIEKDSFKGLKFKIENEAIQSISDSNALPVYAGHDYKKFFSVGDVIKGDSGNDYKIIGFIDNNKLMFGTNSGTDALGSSNNLNSFLIIPYDIDNISKLPPHYDKESFISYSITNSLFICKSNDSKAQVDSTLKKYGIETKSLNYQMKRFTILNFGYVAYVLFITIMILLMCLAGIIGFILSTILSEKRTIGIKIAVGFSKFKIIKEYMLNLIYLISISFVLFVGRYIKGSEYQLTPIILLKELLVVILILIPQIILITYFINHFEANELIGGEK